MKSGDDFLIVKDLTVTFVRWGQAVNALRGVNLNVPQGQWLILVGPNGSGKSTLLKAIGGRIQPDQGQALLKGKSITALSGDSLANEVFLVHQDPLLGTAHTLTVFENLFVADFQAQSDHESKKLLAIKYHDLLKPLGLSERMKQPVKTLSGGERQLMAVLIARLRPSSVILLDEPLAALDPGKAELSIGLINELNGQGKTLIQVTHDPELAVTAGDRTVALDQGRLVYDEMATARSPVAIRAHWYPYPIESR